MFYGYCPDEPNDEAFLQKSRDDPPFSLPRAEGVILSVVE